MSFYILLVLGTGWFGVALFDMNYFILDHFSRKLPIKKKSLLSCLSPKLSPKKRKFIEVHALFPCRPFGSKNVASVAFLYRTSVPISTNK